MTYSVPLTGIAAQDVEALLDDAFGPDRRKRTAYLLRNGTTAIGHMSFGIVEDRALIGCIQCWPVAVADAPLTLVGPVAVASTQQKRGVGHRLMHAMLGAATADDPPMVMIGDPEYYERFGFAATGTGGWTLPGPWEPRRLLLRNPDCAPLPEHGMLGPRL